MSVQSPMRTRQHVEDDAVEVEEHPFAQLDVRAVVAEERRLHPHRLAAPAEQLIVERVIQLAREHLFAFGHGR
jgi:hypothetical protein